MNKDQIKQIHSTKRVKIYLLSKAGLKNSEIAKELGTNAGHVYNVLKDFKDHPEKAEALAEVERSVATEVL